jgi:hypothetical protein
MAAPGGTTGTAPVLQCSSACFVDAPTAGPVKIIDTAAGAGMGTWATSGFTAASLSLSLPTTLSALQTNEVYRIDLLWTLNSAP